MPLFIAQTLELTLNVRPLLIGVRGLQGILQLTQTLVQILLPLGKLLQAIRCLQLLALLCIGRSRCLPLGFVTVFLVRHLQLIQLTLIWLALAVAACPRPRHAIFARGQFQQRLISGLFRRERGG